MVGRGARIDTAAFVASTLNVPDSAFLSGGSLRFSGTSTASIQNLGTINATMGDAVLVGQRIDNQGTIRAPLGTVGLAAGTQVVLSQGGTAPKVAALAAGSSVSIVNTGLVQAGAVEVAACCLAIRDNIIPPTINYEFPDPDCDVDFVPNFARHRRVDVVASNSLGFGGRNTALIIERYRNGHASEPKREQGTVVA